MEHDDAVARGTAAAGKLVREFVPYAGTALDVVHDLLGGNGTKAFSAAIKEELEDGVLRRLPDVERQLHALAAQGVPVRPTEFGRVVEHYVKAVRDAADTKKRELLEAAFVRSFDRELYESGLLNTLWGMLDRLSYGDLALLRDVVELRPGGGGQADATRHQLSDPSSVGAFHAHRLADEGLTWGPVDGGSRTLPRHTALAMKLYELAWKGLPDPE